MGDPTLKKKKRLVDVNSLIDDTPAKTVDVNSLIDDGGDAGDGGKKKAQAGAGLNGSGAKTFPSASQQDINGVPTGAEAGVFVFPTKDNPFPALQQQSPTPGGGQQQPAAQQPAAPPSPANNFGAGTNNQLLNGQAAGDNTLVNTNPKIAENDMLQMQQNAEVTTAMKPIIGTILNKSIPPPVKQQPIPGVEEPKPTEATPTNFLKQDLATSHSDGSKMVDHSTVDPNDILADRNQLAQYGNQRSKDIDKQIGYYENQFEGAGRGMYKKQIDDLKAYKTKLQQSIDYFAQVHAGVNGKDATDAGVIRGTINGDPTASQYNRLKAKGNKTNDATEFSIERQGLQAQGTALDVQYADTPQDPTYNQQKAVIRQQEATLFDRHPEYLKQQWAGVIGDYLSKDLSGFQKMSGLWSRNIHSVIGDMRKAGYDIPKSVEDNISWNDVPDNFDVSGKLLEGAYSHFSGLATGVERIAGTVAGMDKDVLNAGIQKGQATIAQAFATPGADEIRQPETITDTNKNSNTYMMPVPNPKAGKLNVSGTAIAGEVFKGLGGFGAFLLSLEGGASIAKGAAAPEFAGTVEAAKTAHDYSLAANVILGGYEGNYQKATQVIGDHPEDEGKRNILALTNSLIDYAVFKAIPTEKYSNALFGGKQAATEELSGLLKDMPATVNELNTKAIESVLTKHLLKPLAGSLEETAKFGGAQQAAIILHKIAQSVVGNNDESAKEWTTVGKESKEMWQSLPLSMLPGVFGGEFLASKQLSNLRKEGNYQAFTNRDQSVSDIHKAVDEGIIHQEEANSRIQVINTGANIASQMPDVSPVSGKPFTHNESVAWVNDRIKEVALTAQKDKVKDDNILAASYDEKIKALQEERQKILAGTFVPDVAVKKPVVPEEPAPAVDKAQVENEKPAIEKWLGGSEHNDYISYDWDGKVLEIFKSRDSAPVELDRKELIDEGVDFPDQDVSKDYTGKDNNFLANKEPGFFTPEQRAQYNELMKTPETEAEAAKMVADKKAEPVVDKNEPSGASPAQGKQPLSDALQEYQLAGSTSGVVERVNRDGVSEEVANNEMDDNMTFLSKLIEKAKQNGLSADEVQKRVADYIRDHGFGKNSFAYSKQNFIDAIYRFAKDRVEGKTDYTLKELRDEWMGRNAPEEKLTPAQEKAKLVFGSKKPADETNDGKPLSLKEQLESQKKNEPAKKTKDEIPKPATPDGTTGKGADKTKQPAKEVKTGTLQEIVDTHENSDTKEQKDIAYAKHPDGTLKVKSEYTSEEWAKYTKSVIDAKLSKKTLLWGEMNTELPTANVEPTLGSIVQSKYSSSDKAERSQTPEGFAYAFFEANNTSKLRFDAKEENTKQQIGGKVAPDAKVAYKNDHGVSYDEVNKEYEKQKASGISKRLDALNVAFNQLGIKTSEFLRPYIDFVKIKLSEDLPKLPSKKDKFQVDTMDFNGPIEIKPIDQKINPVENTTTAKAGSLSKIVSDDDLRPAMTGVYHDAVNKALVATNAMKMVWLDDPSIKESKIVDLKTGQTIDARFPDYMAVIPKDNPIKLKGLSAQDILNQTAGIDKANRFISGTEIAAVIKIGDTEFGFNPAFLKDIVGTMAANGAKKIDIELSTPTRAVVFSTPDNKDVHALLMPLMLKGWEDDYSHPHKVIYERALTRQEKVDGINIEIASLQKDLATRTKSLEKLNADLSSGKKSTIDVLDIRYAKDKIAELEKQIEAKKTELDNVDNPTVKKVAETISPRQLAITDHLPKDSDVKGVTSIVVSDNGDTVEYGTKATNEDNIEMHTRNRISVKDMSKAEIRNQLDLERRILDTSFADEDYKNPVAHNAKMDQLEKIVIPFYEKHIDLLKNEPDGNETRDTETIIRSTEAVISKAEAATKEKDIDAAAANIEKHINEIESKIGKLKASYSTEGIIHETPSVVINKQVKKELTKYGKGIATQLGWELTAKDVHDNIPPAGGDVTMRFKIPGSPYEMYVAAKYEPEYSSGGGYDNYTFSGFFYRLEEPGAKGQDQYKGGNQWQRDNISAKEMAQILKREAGKYLDKEPVSSDNGNFAAMKNTVKIVDLATHAEQLQKEGNLDELHSISEKYDAAKKQAGKTIDDLVPPGLAESTEGLKLGNIETAVSDPGFYHFKTEGKIDIYAYQDKNGNEKWVVRPHSEKEISFWDIKNKEEFPNQFPKMIREIVDFNKKYGDDAFGKYENELKADTGDKKIPPASTPVVTPEKVTPPVEQTESEFAAQDLKANGHKLTTDQFIRKWNTLPVETTKKYFYDKHARQAHEDLIKAQAKIEPEVKTIRAEKTRYDYKGTDSQGNHLYISNEGLQATYPYLVVSKSGGRNFKVGLSGDTEFPELGKYDLEAKPASGLSGLTTSRNATIPIKPALTRRERLQADNDDEIKDLLRQFTKGDNTLTSGGLSSEKIEIGTKLIGAYLKKGIYKFEDIAERIYYQLGDKMHDFMDAFKSVYSTHYNTVATEEEAAQMDPSVRGIKLQDIIDKINSSNLDSENLSHDDNEADTGTGNAGTAPLGKTTKDVAPDGAQGPLPPDEGIGGTKSLGDKTGAKGDRHAGEDGGRGPTSEPGPGISEGKFTIPVTGGDEKINTDLGGTSKPQEIPKPAEQKPIVTPLQHNGNFVIPPDFEGPKSFNVSAKLQDNIDALKVLVKLKNEDRRATYEEQKALFKYVGWGGIKEIGFDPDAEGGWVASNRDLRSKIKQVHEVLKQLDEDGYDDNIAGIKSSVLNAHYTAIPIIRGMYNVLRKAGFRGGKVVEPSSGIGHFIGAMPIDMHEKSQIGALEKDNITGLVFKGLYPNVRSMIGEGYEDVSTGGANSNDLTISNIPFGNYAVFDRNFNRSKDKTLKASQKKIHSYFFARAIEDTKPNGLISFITSTGILDSKDNADLRRMMADKTEFLGAIRLPNDTFKGNANTSVTTDIIFLRKLGATENPEQKHDFLKTKSEVVKHKNKNSDQQLSVSYNEYFHDNPENILGKVEAGSMYGASKDGLTDAMTVTPTGIDLEKGISDLADKIVGGKIRDTTEEDKVKSQTQSFIKDNGQKAGNLVEMGDGKFGIASDEFGIDDVLDAKAKELGINPDRIRDYDLHTEDFEKLAANGLSAADFKLKKVIPVRIPKKYEGAVKDLLPLRSALNELYAAEYGDMDADFIKGKRDALNKTYEQFVKNNGTLQANKPLLEMDVDGHNMLALENVSDKKVTGLADIFRKRVFQPQTRAESAKDITDAISLNLSETGGLDIDRLAELLGKTPEEVIKEGEGIMFKNPLGDFETKDKYLSGDVRKKLDEAKIAAEADPSYQANVKALEEVQPKDLKASEIYAPVSAPWIATKYLEEFASHLFKQNILINKLATGRVNVDGRVNNTEVSDVYGTADRTGLELLEEAMQNRMPVITRTVGSGADKKTVVDAEATAKAGEKVQKIKEAFDKWIWLDDARRNTLAAHYNETYNNTVLRKYDGSHLKFEGYAGKHTPMPHQMDGAWMITQQMGGILDHIVGSGKSLLMALAANKMKKMGLIKKPIILGLKANAEDLARAYKDSFPLSKVLYPRAKDFTPENRKAFFAKMANNDWDAIVMTHDQFGMIKQPKEIQQEIIGQEIEALENDIRSAKDNKMSKRDINGLETRKQNLDAKLSALSSMRKDPSLKSFDEMGIDFMFVDESQQFKNLQYTTLQKGVSGLGDPTGSAKAFNMLFAIRHLQKMWGADKGTVFASGTPISNTMVEMYLLFKYLRPNKLAEMGINSFDNWANTFASIGSEIEFGVTNSLKPKVRMREFMNVPEMSAMYREIADVRNDSNLQLKKPKFKQTYRLKTDKEIANGEIVTIGDKKFKAIGKIRGLEKNEFYVSLMAQGPDGKLPKSGQIDYEGGKVNYSEVTNSDGLLVNITPTPAQKAYAKKIQKFAETKDGGPLGIEMTDKKKKAYMLIATNLAAKMAIDMRLIDPSLPDTEVGKLGVAANTIAEHYRESDARKGIQLVFSDLGTPKSVNTAENLYDLLESKGVDADTLETVFGAGAKADKPSYPKAAQLKANIMQHLEYTEDQYNDAVIEANEDNFNIYQDMKNKLVKRGIPEHEIVFIHDYKTDAKRKQLFDDARDGKVRVIIGSTAKLGTGVNVQDKIVGMHHLDVPWRPSDMEQRNGRGIRQGNDITRDHYNNELPVYYYATEATLDAYKYQLLDTKQKFIDQGKTGGENGAREISEGDGDEENGVSFAAMTAMLSGNPVILEKAKVDKQVKELSRSSKAFDEEKYTLKDKIASNTRQQKRSEEYSSNLSKDKALFDANAKRHEKTGELLYAATIDGTEYTERTKAGEKLLELRSDFIAEYEKKHPNAKKTEKNYRSGLPQEQRVVGNLNGFDIVMRMGFGEGENRKTALVPEFNVKSPDSNIQYKWTYSSDAVSLAGHLQREVRDLQSDIDVSNRHAAAYSKDAKDQKQYLESLPEEFPRKKEYDAALIRQAKVEATLKEMVKKTTPSAGELEQHGKRMQSSKELEQLAWDDELENIYALTEAGDVEPIKSKEDYIQARKDAGTRFYQYVEPETPEDHAGPQFSIKDAGDPEKEPQAEAVREYIESGITDLKSIQEDVAKITGNYTPALKNQVKEAYDYYHSKYIPKEIHTAVVDRVKETFGKLLGSGVHIEKNSKELLIAANQFTKPEFMLDPKGEVLGFTAPDGSIHLNGEKLNGNTPVHEAGHVWLKWAKENRADLHDKGMSLMLKANGSDTKYLADVRANKDYLQQADDAGLKGKAREEFFRNEALASAIGDQGEKFISDTRKSNFKEWLTNLWDGLKKHFGIRDLSAREISKLTLDEFSKKAAADILSGKPLEAGKKPPADIEGPPPDSGATDTGGGKPDGIGLSQQEVYDRYKIRFKKSPIGWDETSQKGLDRLREDAMDKNTSVESEAKYQVDKMSREIAAGRLTVSEDRWVTVATHLMNVEDNIDHLTAMKATTAEDRAALGIQLEEADRERLKTLFVSSKFGSTTGRTLRLFSGIFSRNDDGGLKMWRRRMEGMFGVELPETVKELDNLPANKMSGETKNKVRPFVSKLEAIKKEYDDSVEEFEKQKKQASADEIKNLQALIKEHNDAITELKDNHQQVSDADKATIQKLEDKIKEHEDTIAEIKESYQQLSDADKAAADTQIKNLEAKIKEHEATIAEKQKLSDADQAKIQKLEDKIKEHETTIADLKKNPRADDATTARKKASDKVRAFADKIRNSKSLDDLGLGKPKGGGQTSGFSFNVKDNLADAIDFIADQVEKFENLDIVKTIAEAAKLHKGTNKEEDFHSLLKLAWYGNKEIDKTLRKGPVPFNVKADALEESMERQRQKTVGQLTQLSRRAEYENRKWYDKGLDWRRALIIGGLKTLGRVSISGVSKFVLDPLVKQTTGRWTSFLPGLGRERASFQSTLEGVQSLLKFNNNEEAMRYVKAKQRAFDIAGKKLSRSDEFLDKLGENNNPAAYQKYELGDHRKIQQDYLKAELANGKASIYNWINGNALTDTKELFKYGSTEFEQSMGGYTQNDVRDIRNTGDKILYYVESMNRLHSVEKNPSARRALVETYNYKLENYQKEGIPLTASTRMRALTVAYGEFLDGKYQTKNQLVDLVNEAKNPKLKPGTEKIGFIKKALSIYLKVALPVAKIGINILKGGIDMSTGGLEGVLRYGYEVNKGVRENTAAGKDYKSLWDKLIDGANNIPEKERIAINKIMGRGLVGIGLMSYALYGVTHGSIQYGGEYDEDHKAKRRYKGKDGEWHTLDYGQWVFGNEHLGKFWSSVLNHLPEFMPIAMVVNTHNVYQYEREYTGVSGRRKTQDKPDAVYDALASDWNEIVERTPYPNLLKPARLAASLISLPIAKDVSEMMDKDADGNLVPRKAKNIFQTVELNTGFRKFVKPTKPAE